MTIPVADDGLRSELLILPDEASLVRIDDCFVLRDPSHPTYWWGNTLRFDRPPTAGDFARWTTAFREHVHEVQPASRHMTFSWVGKAGGVEPFVAAGFASFETVMLAVDRDDPFAAPWPAAGSLPSPVTADDWPQLAALLISNRDAAYEEADYAEFVARRVGSWRTLEARGQGGWFAIRDAGAIVAALGVFVERRPGADGRRIGRFQFVTTHPAARRRGFAGRLVAHASRHAFERLGADTLLIAADAARDARRVYEACGYRPRARYRALERATDPALDVTPSSSPR